MTLDAALGGGKRWLARHGWCRRNAGFALHSGSNRYSQGKL